MKRFLVRDSDGQIFLVVEKNLERAKKSISSRLSSSLFMTNKDIPIGKTVLFSVWTLGVNMDFLKSVSMYLCILPDGKTFIFNSNDLAAAKSMFNQKLGVQDYYEFPPRTSFIVEFDPSNTGFNTMFGFRKLP